MENAFAGAVRVINIPIKPVRVPYQTGYLPGYYLYCDNNRPTVVMVGGGDTYREDLFYFAGWPGWQRNYNVLMVDLPGQGYQWRSWPAPDGRHIDQIANVVEQIKKNPDSRRLIVSAWNPALVDEMALPPCHALFQFYVADGKLSCQLYQRSADIFLGVPFNIASYALLTMMIAQVCGLQPGEFVHTLGDAHIYSDHFEQTELQLAREPRALPKMKLNPAVTDLFDFKFEDFELADYDPHPHIKAAVAV